MYKKEYLRRKKVAEKEMHKDIKRQINKNKKMQKEIKEQINSQIRECRTLLNKLDWKKS